MSQLLAQDVALVTGAGRGIGRAIALRLAASGCALVLAARTERELAAVARAATELGVRALPVAADVTSDSALRALVSRARAEVGPVSILVNNAGFAPPRTRFDRRPLEDWDRTLATCLRAPLVLTHLLLADMMARGRGTIVNVASVAARHARAGEAVYAAAKAGLAAFSRALLADVRDSGVRVLTVSPGLVDTGLIPASRRVDRATFLQPDDVADAVLYALTRPVHAAVSDIVLEPQRSGEPAR